MKEFDFNKLMENPDLVEARITKYLEERTLFKQNIDVDEIKGHILKSEHNLRLFQN